MDPMYELPRSETPLPPPQQQQQQQPAAVDAVGVPIEPSPVSAAEAESPAAIALAPPTSQPPANAPVLNLDQEIGSIVKGIGSFWGSIRKQSVTAYQNAEKQVDQLAANARKDLTPLVSKARANLDHLSEQAKTELTRLSEVPAGQRSGANVVIGADGTPMVIEADPPRLDKGKGVDRSEASSTSDSGPSEEQPTPAVAATAFFTKMQTQLASNPNVTNLSKNFQTSLAGVQSNLAHLPNSFQTNLTQLQAQFPHLDAKTAESYLHKGENWLTEVSGEIGRFAKDAVRVVPPSEAELSMGRTKKREERLRAAEQVAVGRKDTLLHRLRSDPSILLVDPAKPPLDAGAVLGEGESASPDTRELFSRFLQAIEDRGGLEGESFKAQVADEQDEDLKRTMAQLVPSQLSQEAFWSRYFFRRAQIEEDERRRREVLEGAVAAADDEEFSWDMEEEDDDDDDTPGDSKAASTAGAEASSILTPTTLPPPPVSHPASSSTTPIPTPSIGPSSHAPVREPSSSSEEGHSDKKSPRASSDGASSYDVVGLTSGTPSEAPSEKDPGSPVRAFATAPASVPAGKVAEEKEKPQTKEPAPESDGDDSDWE